MKIINDKPGSDHPGQSPSSKAFFGLPKTAWSFVLGASLVAGLGFLGLFPARPAKPDHPQLVSGPAGSNASGGVARLHEPTVAVKGHPGPWGTLEYVKIAIERPDEFVFVNYATNAAARWFFEKYTESQLLELFNSVAATDAQRSVLLDANRRQKATNGVFFTPGQDLVLGLNSQARQAIYTVLADSPQNHFHQNPFTFRAGEFGNWFYRSNLTPETLNLVQGLLYQRGSTLCFSDLPEVLSLINSRAERKRLVKTLSRQSTILMMLHVRPDSNVEALVNYWGKGGRAKDIKSLLESLTRVSGGAVIDVAHLLPRFARGRLYSFPFPTNDPTEARRNCFWTALNFFSETPDDQFCDYKYVEKVMREDYYPIQDEPVFGDIIFLVDAQEAVFHAAVYLADDKVFTKNGRNFTEPWRIMDVQDMLAEYPSNRPVRPVVYRSKKF